MSCTNRTFNHFWTVLELSNYFAHFRYQLWWLHYVHLCLMWRIFASTPPRQVSEFEKFWFPFLSVTTTLMWSKWCFGEGYWNREIMFLCFMCRKEIALNNQVMHDGWVVSSLNPSFLLENWMDSLWVSYFFHSYLQGRYRGPTPESYVHVVLWHNHWWVQATIY